MEKHAITILAFLMLVVPFSLFSYTEVIEYNNRNQVSNINFDNGYIISYFYDSHGNLLNQIITQPNVTPMSPTQFNITSNGEQKTLSWAPVTSNVNGTPIIVPIYEIESSSDPTAGFTLVGTTNQTQYTVSSSNFQQRFYRVRAVVNYQRDDIELDVQIDTITTDTRSNE